MRSGLEVPPAVEAERVIEAVLADLRSGDHRGRGRRLAARRGQVDAGGARRRRTGRRRRAADDRRADQRAGRRPDRAARHRPHPELPVGRLSAVDYAPSERVRAHPMCRVGAEGRRPGGPAGDHRHGRQVGDVTEGTWPWAIVDEAYQMRSDALLRVAPRFERALFVGDPGQLDPFSTVEVDRWTGLSWDPMQSAVAVLLRHNPDLPRAPPAGVLAAAGLGGAGGRGGVLSVHRLPLRHRPGDRTLSFGTAAGGAPSTQVLDAAAATGWGAARAAGPAHPAHRRRGGRGLRRRWPPGAGTRRGRPSSEAGTGRAADRRTGSRSAPRTATRSRPSAPCLPPSAGRRHRRHGEPAAGPGVRRDRRAAPAVRAAGRDRVPPGVRPAVRADLAAPARVRGGGPGRDRRAAGRAPVHRAGPPQRAGQVPGRLGGEPVDARASGRRARLATCHMSRCQHGAHSLSGH